MNIYRKAQNYILDSIRQTREKSEVYNTDDEILYLLELDEGWSNTISNKYFSRLDKLLLYREAIKGRSNWGDIDPKKVMEILEWEILKEMGKNQKSVGV